MSQSTTAPDSVAREVRDACLCLAAQRASRRLARHFDRAFQPVGLTSWQFSLMVALVGLGATRIGQLAEFLAMDRTTLTAALKVLTRQGLVAAVADAKDGRARQIALTEAGSDKVLAAVEIWRREHGAIEVQMADGHARQLRDLLTELAMLPAMKD
ncbi:MAG: MarR family winged helix-turn-helix transcriptional regulator [Ancalomicrobiaceae bacterium]|nr:MarR family winged helix-turn-helix transcriptional regulator [Ancalomicrobiaceae bacterium]